MASHENSAALKEKFVGKTLYQVPAPAAVLDLAKLEVNCERMLDATQKLGLQWRAHIKTHKTTELTRLQVGDNLTVAVKIIVSTILEAEHITPLLQEYQSRGRDVNILYGFPIPPSSAPRLASILRTLGPGTLSIMIDHVDQLPAAATITTLAGHPPLIFLKLDTGYHRAGIPPSSTAYTTLITAVLAAESRGELTLHGLYSHAGHSYDLRSDWDALPLLAEEFTGLRQAAAQILPQRDRPLVLSVGATPTATSIQHPSLPVVGSTSSEDDTSTPTKSLTALLASLRAGNLIPEVHAGVYPTLDLQQVATHARDAALLSAADIAISVLAEVASVYPGRGTGGTTEVLVNAGTLAVGREPVKDHTAGQGRGEGKGTPYDGWGVVMPWGENGIEAMGMPGPEFPGVVSGRWQVGKISQEHGILTWKGEPQDEIPFKVGQRVRIWPNHACIAGAGHGWYLVVDSRNKEQPDVIVDVWARWHGW